MCRANSEAHSSYICHVLGAIAFLGWDQWQTEISRRASPARTFSRIPKV